MSVCGGNARAASAFVQKRRLRTGPRNISENGTFSPARQPRKQEHSYRTSLRLLVVFIPFLLCPRRMMKSRSVAAMCSYARSIRSTRNLLDKIDDPVVILDNLRVLYHAVRTVWKALVDLVLDIDALALHSLGIRYPLIPQDIVPGDCKH